MSCGSCRIEAALQARTFSNQREIPRILIGIVLARRNRGADALEQGAGRGMREDALGEGTGHWIPA